MNELVERIVSRVGLDQSQAEQAVGIILDFLSKEGPADKVRDLLARLPQSNELIAAANDGGGMFASMGGIMGVGSRLMSAGLDMGQIQNVIRELMNYSREKGASAALGEIATSIPGLSQFV